MKKEKHPISKFIINAIYSFFRYIAIVIFHPKVIGKNNIPTKGGFVLAGTHVSKIDFALVSCAVPKKLNFLAKMELFRNKILSSFLKVFGAMPVNRKAKNPELVEVVCDKLVNNEVICVFPEGTINKTKDDIMPFKYGAVSFSKKTSRPIIPFAIIKKRRFFDRAIVVIGKEVSYNQDLEKYNKNLEKSVIKLIRKGRHEKERK